MLMLWPALAFLAVGVSRPLARAPAAARITRTRMAATPTEAELQALLDGPARKVAGKVRKALDKPQGALTIIGGYSPTWESITFAKGEVNARELDDVEYVGRQFRLGGAIAVAPVLGGSALAGGAGGATSSGCTAEQLRLLMEEQQRAKGDFPGPCSFVLDGPLSTPLHLAQAAHAGCVGVCLDVATLGPAKVRWDGARGLAAAAVSLAVELCRVRSPCCPLQRRGHASE